MKKIERVRTIELCKGTYYVVPECYGHYIEGHQGCWACSVGRYCKIPEKIVWKEKLPWEANSGS